MKINQLKWGSILSYLQMALGAISSFIYTPLMIRLLGQSEYGLYNTVASTISMLSVLSLGFNSSYIRFYSKYKIQNDNDAIYKLNGLFMLIFTIIGFIALICGLYLAFNLELVFKQGLTIEEYKVAKRLMILLTINLSVSFPMSVFTSIISAHERYVFLKVIGMLKTVVGPFITIPLLLLGYRSVGMVVVTILITFFTDMVYFVYVKNVLKNRFIFYGFEQGIFKSLFIYTFFIALNLVVDQVNSNLGKIMLGRYKGTGVVAVYSVGYSLYQYYMMFSCAVSGVFTPRIHNIVNALKENKKKQGEQLTDLFIKVGRIQFSILSLISTGFVFWGKSFVRIWAGNVYEEAYFVAILLMVSSSIALIQNLGIEIQRAQNKHQFRSLVYVAMACINLILTMYLCPRYGAVGTAVGTAISLVIANGFIMNIYYQKRCNINIMLFWKNIIHLSRGLVIPLLYGTIFIDLCRPDNLWNMLIGIITYVCVYFISMYYFGFNIYEREFFMHIVKKERGHMAKQ